MKNFENLREFLIKSLRLEDHSPEEQDEVLLRLRQLIEAQIDSAVVSMLSESDILEAEKIKKTGDAAAFRAFLQEKIPNLPFVLESVGLKTLKDYGVDIS